MSGDKISGRSLDHDPFVMDDAAGFSHWSMNLFYFILFFFGRYELVMTFLVIIAARR